jgi:hypothetical protein
MPAARKAPAKTVKLRGGRYPLNFTVPPELVAAIDKIAAEERRSRANMIEVVLEDFVRSRKAHGRAA